MGVVAANDGTGGGAIAAFKAAGVKPVPPVTGNDAELAALQRIITGDQYNTISKPIEIVASAAAEAAYAMLQGKQPKQTANVFNTPSELFIPFVVTEDEPQEADRRQGAPEGLRHLHEAYAEGCAALGIK